MFAEEDPLCVGTRKEGWGLRGLQRGFWPSTPRTSDPRGRDLAVDSRPISGEVCPAPALLQHTPPPGNPITSIP